MTRLTRMQQEYGLDEGEWASVHFVIKQNINGKNTTDIDWMNGLISEDKVLFPRIFKKVFLTMDKFNLFRSLPVNDEKYSFLFWLFQLLEPVVRFDQSYVSKQGTCGHLTLYFIMEGKVNLLLKH